MSQTGRVLLLSWNFPPAVGGIESVVGNLWRGLRDRGLDVYALVAHSTDDLGAPGLERCPTPGLAAYLRFAWRRGRRLPADAIVCGSIASAPVAWWLARTRRLPWAVLVYGSDLVWKRPGYRGVVRFFLRRADRVVACSEGTGELALAHGVARERLRVVYPGVEVERFSGPSPEPPFPGRRVLLSVGRLVRRKGLVEFVERVLPRVVEAEPRALFAIVGDDAHASLAHRERLREHLEATAARLGLADHVRVLGELPDPSLLALYRSAELFVLPALDVPGDVEGFGIVLVESQLAGTPCVATRVGGIPEAVADRETGLLVPPGDDPALLEAILSLLGDTALRERLADRARTWAAGFAWDRILEEHEAWLAELLGR